MKKRQLAVLSLMIGLLLVPMVAAADNHEMAPKPLTWLNYVMSQPGKGTALTQNIAKGGAEIYDGMMADGHVLTWGVGMPVNHRAGDNWNVVEWVTFRDWAAVDTFMQKFMGMQMSKSPEEMMAEQKEWKSLVEAGSHYDEILRHMVVVPGQGPPPAYVQMTYTAAEPGQAETLENLWVGNLKPTMDRLQSAGAIGAFGLAAQEVHDGSGAELVFWTALPNLAARDAIVAAMAVDAKARGEEAQMKMMKEFAATTDFSAHHDRIIMVVHNGGGAGDSGEGGGEGEGGE